MSHSRDKYDHHLTPSGWVDGSEDLDGCKTIVEPPEDNLLTVREYREMSHWAADEDVYCREVWRSPDSKAVEAAIAIHGVTPNVRPGHKNPPKKKR